MRAGVLALVFLVPHALRADQDTLIEANICGANSLSLTASYVRNVHPDQVHNLLPQERAPFSLKDLEAAAQALGLQTAILHWNNKDAARFACPAVLHVRASESSAVCDHFIACFGERGSLICVADYPFNPALVPRERLFEFWGGDALYIDDPSGKRIKGLRRPNQVQAAIAFVLAGLAIGASAILFRCTVSVRSLRATRQLRK